MSQLSAAYEDYRRAPVLATLAAASPFVPGHGLVPAPLMVVGDYPGIGETEAGLPFAEDRQEFLYTEMERAGLPPAMSFFTLAVKYRAPGGRPPYPFEVEASRPCLVAEVLAVRPVVIAALGDVSQRMLTGEPGNWGIWQRFTAPGVDWDCHLMPLPSVQAALEWDRINVQLISGLEQIGAGNG